jgi:hypothetical protein
VYFVSHVHHEVELEALGVENQHRGHRLEQIALADLLVLKLWAININLGLNNMLYTHKGLEEYLYVPIPVSYETRETYMIGSDSIVKGSPHECQRLRS